jgi:predicted transcriptional regulator
MTSSRERLQAIAEQIKEGRQPDTVSVRTLLQWFYAQRRGSNVVWRIRRQLREAGLATEPDFESSWIDAQIQFVAAIEDAGIDESSDVGSNGAAEVEVDAPDPTYRISKLESANRTPVWVNQDETLAVAVALMLANDYSQLPVMQDERNVKGMISWGTIGKRLSLSLPSGLVRDCMTEQVNETGLDTSLFAAIDGIIKNEYVLVRRKDQTICGIVTTSDLSNQFLLLAEPFLLLGEIENHIRRMIDGRFSGEQLESVRDPSDGERTIETAADLTFGEYIRLLERPDHWSLFKLGIDRTVFVHKLDRVREIRNDVMHFDPDGTPGSDLQILRTFLKMLQELAAMGAV